MDGVKIYTTLRLGDIGELLALVFEVFKGIVSYDRLESGLLLERGSIMDIVYTVCSLY